MSETSEPASESPLAVTEKESEEFKKEVEENIKKLSKIELKSKGKDKDALKEAASAYREALEDALNQINELKERASDLQIKISELKKEYEAPTLKEKDFSKRQINEAKKIRDTQEKLEKLNKKLKLDLEKQVKTDEKENAKIITGSESSSTIKSLFSKASKQDDKAKSEENLSGEPGLKEMIRAEKKKLQEAIDTKENQSKMYELKEEDKANLESDKKNSLEKKSEVKGLKELVKEEKLVLLNAKKEAEKKQHTFKTEPELDERDDFEAVSDLEQSGNGPKQTEEIDHKDGEEFNDSKEKEENEEEDDDDDDDYDEEDITELNQTKNAEKNEKQQTPENISKKDESKNDKTQIKAQEEEKKEPKKKSESIFFGLFKSKSSTSLAKDAVKKLEKEEQKQEKDNLVKIEDKLDDQFKEGTMLLVVESFEPEYEGDLRIKKDQVVEFLNYGDDDPAWIEVKNNEGHIGFVPKENVKIIEEKKSIKQISQKSTDSKKSGKDLWISAKLENLKKQGLIEKTKPNVPDNFTNSILYDLIEEPSYSFEHYLKPKLSESNLSFKNLHWDLKENKLRNKMVSFQKIFIIHKCTNIPLPDKELTVLSRSVRVCLFDGELIQSNVHTIQGHLVGKDERTWIFEDDLSESISIMDYSEFFVRINLPNDRAEIPPNLGILFELSVYCKNNATNEESNFCCGWAHIPFHDAVNKQQIVNKSYELPIRGGSISDNINKPLVTNSKNLSSMSDVVAKIFKESKIKFNVKEPNNYLFDTLNALPEPFIASTIVAPFIKYYREQLGEEFVAPLIEIGSFESTNDPIHDVFLSTFPNALYHPDILDQVKHSFLLTKESMRRDEKNDNLKLRRIFIKLYNETCYPLLYHSLVPGLNLNSNEDLETRSSLINRCTKLVRKEKLLEYLLDGREEFEPFQIDELSYELSA